MGKGRGARAQRGKHVAVAMAHGQQPQSAARSNRVKPRRTRPRATRTHPRRNKPRPWPRGKGIAAHHTSSERLLEAARRRCPLTPTSTTLSLLSPPRTQGSAAELGRPEDATGRCPLPAAALRRAAVRGPVADITAGATRAAMPPPRSLAAPAHGGAAGIRELPTRGHALRQRSPAPDAQRATHSAPCAALAPHRFPRQHAHPRSFRTCPPPRADAPLGLGRFCDLKRFVERPSKVRVS